MSFYVYDAGFVLANSIAKRPFPTGKPDRGQSLLFQEFIQSWVGYELVKVLVTYGLQPITLSSKLKNWSPDLHTIFTYMLTKDQKMKTRAEEILEVLFSKTLHCGYWSHVQFGTRKKFFDNNNSILCLVVLTWMRQLQEFFLNDDNLPSNGNWNKWGKYTGVTGNPYKQTMPLANINFSTLEKPGLIEQVTSIDQFKPHGEISGVCTSLEEWAFRILRPKHRSQFEELIRFDLESEERFVRATEDELQMFEFSAKDLIINNDEDESEIKYDGQYNTETSKNSDLSQLELASQLNLFLDEHLKKAEKRLKTAKKIGHKELQQIKTTYNAASAFASIMSSTLQREQAFKDYDEMKKHVADNLDTTIDEEESKSGMNDSDSKDVDANVAEEELTKNRPTKKRKLNLGNYFKTNKESSDEEFELDDDEDTDG